MHSAVNLCGVGMPRLTARLLLHSTATAMKKDPPWQSLSPAVTYLVDIRICLGKVSIYEIGCCFLHLLWTSSFLRPSSYLFQSPQSSKYFLLLQFFSCFKATICRRVFIVGSCSYSAASKAFLFSLYNKDGYNPVKLTQYRNHQYAMYSCSHSGPRFGNGYDIYISNNALDNSASYTRCGYTYSAPTGYSTGSCGFFTGGYHFTPTDIEVFYEIGNKLLFWGVWCSICDNLTFNAFSLVKYMLPWQWMNRKPFYHNGTLLQDLKDCARLS